MKVHFSSASDRWATPPDVYAALNDEFNFNFDPCPLDGTENGLARLFVTWEGKRVFCNPPYGPGIGEWLKRGLEAQVAVFLIPARTDTRWFHEIVMPNAKEIRFLKGRLKFGNAENSAPFPSMVVVFENGKFQPATSTGNAPHGTDLMDAHLNDRAAEQKMDDLG
jgi:hypothetical protein